MLSKELKNKDMDTKALKDKILQLALQGKLVNQDPNDEPASVILVKIAQEKDMLVKEAKIKEEKQLPPINQDEIRYKLPKGWEWVRLGDIINFIGGQQPPKSTFKYHEQDGYVRLIQIRDYKSDENITYVPKEKARRFSSIDDVMIGRYGPPIFQILRGLEGAYNVALMKAEPKGNSVTKSFLYYLLKDPELYILIERLSNRTCGQDGVDIKALREYIIGLPPIAEQNRIVEKIHALFLIIDELENERIELLEAVKNSRNAVLQEAVQGKLVSQDPNDEPASALLEEILKEKERFIKEGKVKKEMPLPPITENEIPYEVPKGWEWVKIATIMELINGRAFKPSEWSEKGLPIIRIQNLNNVYAPFNYCDFDIDKKFIVDNGDILIGWSGTPGTSFGASSWSRGRAVLNQHIFKAVLFIQLDSRYVIHAINSKLSEMIGKAHGGVGLQHITKDKFSNIIIPLPPLVEQKRIVEKVDQTMSLCDELEKNIEQSKNDSELLMQSVLQEAFKES